MGCVRAAKLNIVLNSIVEQIHILKYHAHILQEAVTGKLFDIVAAYGNAAFLHIPKPGDQPCNGGFAASRGTDNRSHAALWNGKTHILQNWIAILISKGHMLEANVKGIQRDVPTVFINFFCLFDTLYPVKGSVHCPNHCRHLAHNLNRIEDGKGSDQNNGEISERQVAANSEDSRAQHNHAGRNTEHHRIGHIERGKYTLHPIRGSRIALIGIFNIAQIFVAHIEGFYNGNTLHVFQCGRNCFGLDFLPLCRESLSFFLHVAVDWEGKKDACHENQTDTPVKG